MLLGQILAFGRNDDCLLILKLRILDSSTLVAQHEGYLFGLKADFLLRHIDKLLFGLGSLFRSLPVRPRFWGIWVLPSRDGLLSLLFLSEFLLRGLFLDKLFSLDTTIIEVSCE